NVTLSSNDLAAYGARIKGVSGEGQVEGEGSRYKVAADLSSNEILASGTQIHEVKIDGIKVEDDGAKIVFETRRAYAQTAIARGARLIDLSAGALHGGVSRGCHRSSAPRNTRGTCDRTQERVSCARLCTDH